MLRSPVSNFSATHRAGAERILYALGQGSSCHLLGTRAARSGVLSQVKVSLQLAGVRTSQFHLAGMEPTELPTALSVSLGLGGSSAASYMETWLRLTEFFQGCESTELQQALLWNLEFASPDLIPALQRVIQLTAGVAAHVFSTDETAPQAWQEFLRSHDFTPVQLADVKPATANWARQPVPVQ